MLNRISEIKKVDAQGKQVSWLVTKKELLERQIDRHCGYKEDYYRTKGTRTHDDEEDNESVKPVKERV